MLLEIPSILHFLFSIIANNALWFCLLVGKWEALVTQVCLTLCDRMDYSPPDSSVHGILQAKTLEWIAMRSSRESSQARDWTQVTDIAGSFFTTSATWEAQVILWIIANTDLFPSSIVRLYTEHHLFGTIQYATFADWLLLLMTLI